MTSSPRRIYLDQAATSWPKSAEVVQAATDFVTQCGATAGRGSYSSSLVAERWLHRARRAVAELIGTHDTAGIAFCNSGTHALNSGLWGILRPGDHVLTTSAEHNSLLRPLMSWQELLDLKIDIVPTDSSGLASVEEAAAYLKANTRVVAVGHASNVTGAVQSVEAWGQMAHANGSLLLVDASQTLGYLPCPADAWEIDVLASAGHKGIGGLAGTGLLYVRQHLRESFRPLMFGGTGRSSEQLLNAQAWPDHVEVGNLNVPAIAALAVACEDRLQSEPVEPPEIDAKQMIWWSPFKRIVEGLANLPAVELVGVSHPSDMEGRIPVVSIRVAGWDVHDLASVLDTEFGIEVRAGLHCAALVHANLSPRDASLETVATKEIAAGQRKVKVMSAQAIDSTPPGTLRFSTGHTTTLEEVDFALAAMKEILAG